VGTNFQGKPNTIVGFRWAKKEVICQK